MTMQFQNRNENYAFIAYSVISGLTYLILDQYLIFTFEANVILVVICFLLLMALIKYFSNKRAIGIETLTVSKDSIEIYLYKTSVHFTMNIADITWKEETDKLLFYTKNDPRLLCVASRRQCFCKEEWEKLLEHLAGITNTDSFV